MTWRIGGQDAIKIQSSSLSESDLVAMIPTLPKSGAVSLIGLLIQTRDISKKSLVVHAIPCQCVEVGGKTHVFFKIADGVGTRSG